MKMTKREQNEIAAEMRVAIDQYEHEHPTLGVEGLRALLIMLRQQEHDNSIITIPPREMNGHQLWREFKERRVMDGYVVSYALSTAINLLQRALEDPEAVVTEFLTGGMRRGGD